MNEFGINPDQLIKPVPPIDKTTETPDSAKRDPRKQPYKQPQQKGPDVPDKGENFDGMA